MNQPPESEQMTPVRVSRRRIMQIGGAVALAAALGFVGLRQRSTLIKVQHAQPLMGTVVNFTVLAPDPHGFDRNNDGVGCES